MTVSLVDAAPQSRGGVRTPDTTLSERRRATDEATDRNRSAGIPGGGPQLGRVQSEWNGQRGFVPAPHLKGLSPFTDENQRIEELWSRVGSHTRLSVFGTDQRQRQWQFSLVRTGERVTCSDEEGRRESLAGHRLGDTCRGSVMDARFPGAFVDLRELDVSVRVSWLLWI